LKGDPVPTTVSLQESNARFDAVIDAVALRLAKNQRLRRTLPGAGRLKFDRQLPFLCVYRAPVDRQDPGTYQLVTSEAAYLFASADTKLFPGLSALCEKIVSAMQEHFGFFLLIEIWSDSQLGATELDASETGPVVFEIVGSELDAMPAVIETFQAALGQVTIQGKQAVVTRRSAQSVAPPRLPAITPSFSPTCEASCYTLGLAVKPVYHDPQGVGIFPLVLQRLRRQLAMSLRKTMNEFFGREKQSSRGHYHVWGPSALVQATRRIDDQLSEIAASFDFLLQVTPVNADQAWRDFRASGFRDLPPLVYRPLPYDPSQLKRRLFGIELERVEDPTVAYLFAEQQVEIDRKLSALRDLNWSETGPGHHATLNFQASSLQLYGRPETSLVALAHQILATLPVPPSRRRPRGTQLDARALSELAQAEIDHYHQGMKEFDARVEISTSITSGMMVSQDRLLIDHHTTLSLQRAQALLHHEIGTHLLTYFNGRCQRFRQLAAGLAGYEELQEGLAVFAEYLAGGLTKMRLRTLAARVLAVDAMLKGRTFEDAFRLLHRRHRFASHRAFTTVLRAYRGGGFTKDIIYLRGLRDLLEYLAAGHDMEPLYVGKIGLHHVPYVQDLRRRGVIVAPRKLPRLWDEPRVRQRLAASRGKTVLDLV